MPKTIIPKPLADTYTCPFCDVTTKVRWYGMRSVSSVGTPSEEEDGYYELVGGRYCYNGEVSNWAFAECSHCSQMTVWRKDRMVYPSQCPVGEPNEDMPTDVMACYREAADVLQVSPRSSAALLRLGLQHLLKNLLGDESSGHLYTDIKKYSERVPIQITKALDTIRITGNESVHPGTIDLNDDPGYAEFLFVLMNMICDESITRPRMIEEAYQSLPKTKRLVAE